MTNNNATVILARLNRLSNSKKISFMYNDTRRTAYIDSVNFNKNKEPYVKCVEQNKGYRTYSVLNMSDIRTLKTI